MTGPMTAAWLVFSDLDGTLLDHDDYGFAPALPALRRLRELAIPLFLCSSKTAAEVAPLRAELGFDHCEAIVENGAGILEPHAVTVADARTLPRLLEALERLPPRLRDGFSGFSGWDLETLIARTGLDPESARRARQRDFSEPGLWRGDAQDRAEFVRELARGGIHARQGGRFLTLSCGADKAAAVRRIIARYRGAGSEPRSVALGDAPNDVAMLEAADLGIIVPNPAHAGIPPLAGESCGLIMRAGSAGPAGWNSSLLALLDGPQAVD